MGEDTKASRELFKPVSSGEELKRIISDEQPSLVLYHADWCTPCKTLLKHFGEHEAYLRKELDSLGMTRRFMADTDIPEIRVLAAEYGVRAVPTIVIYQNCDILESIIGCNSSYQRFVCRIETTLKRENIIPAIASI
jgi:thiol:disulfide interchange protein